MFKQFRYILRHVLPRLAVVIGFLTLVAPKPTLFDVQRWLEKGDEAAQNQDLDQAADFYERAEKRGASLTDWNITSSSSIESVNANDALVLLLAESEQNGWSDATRQQYAEYRQALGSSLPMLALFNFDPDALGDDIIPVLHDLATTEVAKKNWEAAVEYLETLLILQPADDQTNYLLGLITLTEDTRRAFAYFDTIGEDSAFSPSVDRLREVVLNFNTPVSDVDYQSLGLALIDLEEWVFAERAFNAALSLDNQDWQSYTYRGYVRDHIDGDTGFKDYGSALALAPGSPVIYYFLGLHWRQFDDLEASQEAFLNAYFLETSNPAYAVEVARAYQLLGDNIVAEEWFNIAVSLEPNNIQWQQLRAAFYADEGFALESDGMTAIQEANALAPEDSDILTSLGYAYLQLENIDIAQSYLERAIAFEPNNARTQYIYGLIMKEKEDIEAATNAFLQAIELEGAGTGYGLLAARLLEQLGIALP